MSKRGSQSISNFHCTLPNYAALFVSHFSGSAAADPLDLEDITIVEIFAQGLSVYRRLAIEEK
mgnify:CR=1|tara:strand:- start:208 stop:396 length:189 start_codon:yes stop_codon:yes gene_type:complete